MQPTFAHSKEVLADYEQLRTNSGSRSLTGESLYHLTGEDVATWLQGQVTQNVLSLPVGGGAQFCLCTPTGQLIFVGRLWRVADGFLMNLERSAETALNRRVAQTVIMEDVVVSKCENLHGYTFQGPKSQVEVQALVGISMDNGVKEMNGGWALPSERTGPDGWDLWCEHPLVDLKDVSADAWEIARIESGLPASGLDFSAKTLPPELGRGFESKTISYSKGCYTGQEVLMRIHSRGHTNRTWMGLFCDYPVLAGSNVSHSLKEDAGVVTAATVSPKFGAIATAHLRNESAVPGEMVIVHSGDQKVEAKVIELPFLRKDS